MTRPILCFGELLIDFLNTDLDRSSDLTLPVFTQFPGGAPANACVAAAKLGAPTRFLGQVGTDQFGNFLKQTLENYHVDTTYLRQTHNAKTPLAFVFLDAEGDRSFEFFRKNTADLIFKPEDIDLQCFDNISVFHFCSNTLTEPAIAETTAYAIQKAIEANALISFDVNLRHNLWENNQADTQLIYPFLLKSHFIKFSKEEFDAFAQNDAENFIQRLFQATTKMIVITDGGNPLKLITPNHTYTYAPPPVHVVDTTAGGDAFSGAMIYGLAFLNQPIETLPISTIEKLVRFACHCGNHAVSIKGAFPSLPTSADVPIDF